MAERYILQFPRGVTVTIFPYDKSPLEDKEFLMDFKRKITHSFAEYTKGTNLKYIAEDKLSFIDLIRELNFKVSGEEIVNEWIRQEFDDKDEVYLEDISDTEEIESMIDEGIRRYKKSWSQWCADKHANEIAIALVSIAIRQVLNYIPTIEPVKTNRGDEKNEVR